MRSFTPRFSAAPRLSVAVGLVVIAFAAAGCASIDPTEQFFAIAFRNDLGRTATLKACGDKRCQHFTDVWTLAPGDSASDNISDRSVLTRWLVEGAQGSRKCLPLVFDAKYENVVVKLSQAEPCPGQPLVPNDVAHGKKEGGET